MQLPGGGGAGAAGEVASGGAAAAVQQADTRPLPPIGGAKAGRLPRVASWRDVLEIGSSSSSKLRELGEARGRVSLGLGVGLGLRFLCRLWELGEAYLRWP